MKALVTSIGMPDWSCTAIDAAKPATLRDLGYGNIGIDEHHLGGLDVVVCG
jgi:hypothetical protein